MSEADRPRPRPITSWQAAEENAAAWMCAWGYPHVALTKGGADKGVDVRAAGAIAQVKFEAAQVGRPALQRLVGARGKDYDIVMLFFTGAGYSRQAINYADDVGIGLYLYALDGAMSAMNERAKQLAEGHGVPIGPTPEQVEAERQRHQKRLDAHYAALWSTYRIQAETLERGDGFGFQYALNRLDEEEDRFPLELPDWWIVPPPKNWRDNNPDKEERARELEAERLKAQRQRARSERLSRFQ